MSRCVPDLRTPLDLGESENRARTITGQLETREEAGVSLKRRGDVVERLELPDVESCWGQELSFAHANRGLQDTARLTAAAAFTWKPFDG